MDRYQKVREFHEKFGFPIACPLEPKIVSGPDFERMLGGYEKTLERLKYETGKYVAADLRTARLNLIFEELGELCEALRLKNRLKVADALADLEYVVVGSAVAFGIPIVELFDDVHASNMTKDVDGRHKPTKGADYRAPRTQEILYSGTADGGADVR